MSERGVPSAHRFWRLASVAAVVLYEVFTLLNLYRERVASERRELLRLRGDSGMDQPLC
jgi:hypothetical protein